MTFKDPGECQSMAEIRQAIDAIDEQVINSWAQRFEYVKAAAKFKTDATAVRAPERFAAMLVQRREWAQQNGLDPDVIEGIYRDLVTYFIREELKHWQQPAA